MAEQITATLAHPDEAPVRLRIVVNAHDQPGQSLTPEQQQLLWTGKPVVRWHQTVGEQGEATADPADPADFWQQT